MGRYTDYNLATYLYRIESESDMSSGSDNDVMITSVVSSVQLTKYVNWLGI